MVVEIPVSVVAGGTVKLGTFVVEEIRAANAVAERFKELEPKLGIIKGLLADYGYKEEMPKERQQHVQGWLMWVSNVAYYAEDLSDEFEIHQLQHGGGRLARKVSEFFSSNNKYVFYLKVSKKFEKIKEDVDQIVKHIPYYLDIIKDGRNSKRETHKKKERSGIIGRMKRGIAAIGGGSKIKESERLSLLNSENLCSPGGQKYLVSDNNLDLPTHLKPCFAYCTLFPTDYKIKKKLLVQMWIAQGFIPQEDLGNQYFEELVSKLLLVGFKDANNNILSYKMHNPNNCRCTVMGSEVLTLEGDHKVNIKTEFRHVSLFKSVHLKGKALDVEHIRTFLTMPDFCKHEDGCPGYCQYEDGLIERIGSLNFKRLRVLSLNGCKRKRLPKFIGRLCHLRYLDLSYNDVEKIPKSVTRLKCLQTLRVVGCKNLKRLRRDTREMTSLRHLENDECPSMSKMPFGIGELTELRSLSVFVVGDVKKEDLVGRLSELNGLNNLRGELSIVNLENADADESRKANLRAKQYLKLLRLEWSRSKGDAKSESVLRGLGLDPSPNLEGLIVQGYGGRRFPTLSFPHLSQLEISSCHQLASLELHSFRFLSSLTIIDCPELTSVRVHSLNRLKVKLRGVREEVWRQLFVNWRDR